MSQAPLPRASLRETLGLLVEVLLPLVGRGVIARRPRVVALLERIDADRRAVRRLVRLRRAHGRGPVVLRLPLRTTAFVLEPDDVRRVLDGSPEPFATASVEKRHALGHFQPHGVLVSDASARAVRRPFNEQALDEPRPLHGFADRFVTVVREEAAPLLSRDALGWDPFLVAWWRTVRRIVLGDGARDDHELTDLLAQLRHDANWSYARPKRRRVRARFLARLREHVERAEEGSLAARVAGLPAPAGLAPVQQVPQWLFAFEPAGMAAFRALALVAAHPGFERSVRAELDAVELERPQELPLLRAAVLESLRLWPTTPAIVRDTTAETAWPAGTLEAGAGVLIFAPLFHRDPERLPQADRFAPEAWLDGEPPGGFVPFSGGPAICPGRNLVQLATSTFLARVLEERAVRLERPRLDPDLLPGTLDPFRLRFRLAPASTSSEVAPSAAAASRAN